MAGQIAALNPARLNLPTLGLRIADTLIALVAGGATEEGRALARMHDVRTWRLGDPASGRIDGAALSAAAATIRLTEIDDIQLDTCITPSAVAVPAALAAAMAVKAPPPALARGLAAAYGTMFRHGRSIGGAAALAQGIWPSLLVAPMGAAAASAAVLGLDAGRTAHALRMALLRSTARIGATRFPLSARWYVFGEAVADGVKAAFAAAEGFELDDSALRDLLMPEAAASFDEPFGPDEAGTIASKPFCTARQAANGVVAYQELARRHGFAATQIRQVEVEVPPVHLAMVSRKVEPGNRLSTLTSQGFQIAAAALRPDVLDDVARDAAVTPDLVDFAGRVSTRSAEDLARHWPARWPARVTVELAGGERLTETCLEIDGDPGRPLDLDAIVAKKMRLAPDLSDALLRDAAAAIGSPDAFGRVVGQLVDRQIA